LKESLNTAADPLWCSAPEALKLAEDEVHVWRASLKATSHRLRSLRGDLFPDEQVRADRYYFQKDRGHFIVARGLLRALLGHYLNRKPNQIRFDYGEKGKPELMRETGSKDLRFNLSHSHGLALYAFTYGREIGIDLEWIRPDLANEQIAERFFSPREVATLRALPTHMQPDAFFACWTRKEAFLKALGDGLARPLDRFDVSLAPGEPARLLHIDGELEEVSRWSLQELKPAPGYAAAIAVEGHGWNLARWKWVDEPVKNSGLISR
jgi:4'-phosphopantetheinyl transferase